MDERITPEFLDSRTFMAELTDAKAIAEEIITTPARRRRRPLGKKAFITLALAYVNLMPYILPRVQQEVRADRIINKLRTALLEAKRDGVLSEDEIRENFQEIMEQIRQVEKTKEPLLTHKPNEEAERISTHPEPLSFNGASHPSV